MLQFTIIGTFPEGDALEVANAWGYQPEIMQEVPPVDPEGESTWAVIPNPQTPEQFVLSVMEKDCADKIAAVYKLKAFKAKEQLFLAEVDAQNSFITNNIQQSITSEVVPVTP